ILNSDCTDMLFIPFTGNYSPGRNGIGRLNLSPVYSLINSTGGTVEFERDDSSEMSIVIKLPATKISYPNYQTFSPAGPEKKLPASASGLNVLVLENNSLLQNIIVKTVISSGGKSEIVTSGKSALEMLDKKSYNLFFVDIIGTGNSVKKLLNNFREKAGNTTVIMVMRNGEEELVESLGLKNFYFIEKNFDSNQVKNIINKAIGNNIKNTGNTNFN
ncbi:MAG: response regulator, partial [Candidatus Eremiobacteraeota bacterium]|nr:response regulator [Candidatus Eremiobacteraeota bacterium]